MDSATLCAHFAKFANRTPLEINGLSQLALPATPQLMDSATLSAHCEKFTKLTSLDKNGLAQLPLRPTSPTGHPSTNGIGNTQRTFQLESATLNAHFVTNTSQTPLEKMDSRKFPYLPPLN
jgi:hypothetical protein